MAINQINDKKYVGQTKRGLRGMDKRKSEHIRGRLHPKTPFQKAIKEFGQDAFEWKILEKELDNHLILDFMEKFWIVQLETRIYQNGYNVHKGGGKIYREGPLKPRKMRKFFSDIYKIG